MELNQKENIIPQGIENLVTKKTPKSTRKVQIFEENEGKEMKVSHELEIERLKQKCKEAEERTEEWKKKFKSQADTFRDNFDNFKNLKLENQKLSNELAEFKNSKQTDSQLLEQIRNLKQKIQELTEESEKFKKQSLVLENRELKVQVEKFNKLFEDLFEVEQLEKKWFSQLNSTKQILLDERKSWKQKEEIHLQNIIQLTQELESLNLKFNQHENKEKELYQQLDESILKEKQVLQDNMELSQLVLYLQERIQALEHRENDFNQAFQENQTLKESIQEKSKEISNLQERLIGLSDEASHYKDKYKQEQEKYKNLENDNQNLNDQNDKIQKSLNEKELILQNLNINQSEKEKEILETWSLIQQKLSEMEKKQEMFNRTDRNLKSLNKKHEELIEFSDQERKIREEFIISIQEELEKNKKDKERLEMNEEEMKKLLNQQNNQIQLLEKDLSKHKLINSQLEQDNLEKTKNIKTNNSLIQDLEKSLMDSKTLNFKITKFIHENCKLCGINGETEDPILKITEVFKSYNFLNEQNHNLLNLLEDMQKTIVYLEEKNKEKESIVEQVYKEFNEQIGIQKGQLKDQYDKEMLKFKNVEKQMEILLEHNENLLKTNHSLETKLNEYHIEIDKLLKSKNEIEKKYLENIKKIKNEIPCEINKELFDKVVKRSEYLETVTYDMNLEIATLQREKKELSLRMEIFLLEKYKQISGAELLIQCEESKTMISELEQKGNLYYSEIQRYKKELYSCNEQFKNDQQKMKQLNYSLEKSKLQVEELNLILCKSKQVLEKYHHDPLCQDVINLLEDK